MKCWLADSRTSGSRSQRRKSSTGMVRPATSITPSTSDGAAGIGVICIANITDFTRAAGMAQRRSANSNNRNWDGAFTQYLRPTA